MDAQSPEQLDELLEDAVLLADGPALRALLDEDAVLVGPDWDGGPEAALDLLRGHLAGGRCTHLPGGLAVTVGPGAVVVSRQERHGWTGVVVVRRHGGGDLAHP